MNRICLTLMLLIGLSGIQSQAQDSDESRIALIETLLANPDISQSDSIRLEDEHSRLMLNRVGHKANDFEIVTRDGSRGMLSDFVTAPVNLLMFYDPDCIDCNEMEQYLASDDFDKTDTRIILICPYEVDYTQLLAHASKLPADWVVARPTAEDFEDLDLYEFRISPTVLILDASMIVKAKNLTLENLSCQNR